tara:strand:- start:1728 stop:2414 length:687 start_codon:yes stop_codon:yes gene_type:complete
MSEELKVRTNYLEITDLEKIELKTEQDGNSRYYVDTNGARYPSVTTVVGLSTRDHIKLWRDRVGEEEANRISTTAARKGTKFHDLVERYLRREEPEIIFENLIQEGQFKSIQPILDEIIPFAIEPVLYSDRLKMAGRADCIGMLDGAITMLDWKTSAKYKKEEYAKPWYLQMTAYSIMVEELTGQPIDEIMAVVALENAQFQVFVSNPVEHVQDLVDLRNRYKNLYGI